MKHPLVSRVTRTFTDFRRPGRSGGRAVVERLGGVRDLTLCCSDGARTERSRSAAGMAQAPEAGCRSRGSRGSSGTGPVRRPCRGSAAGDSPPSLIGSLPHSPGAARPLRLATSGAGGKPPTWNDSWWIISCRMIPDRVGRPPPRTGNALPRRPTLRQFPPSPGTAEGPRHLLRAEPNPRLRHLGRGGGNRRRTRQVV